MRWYQIIFLSVFLFCMQNCNSSSSAVTDDTTDDTGGDSASLDTSALATTMQNGAQALVLNISASEVQASTSAGFSAVISGTTEQWDQYFEQYSYNLLTDVFGPADEAPQVVTKISVQLEEVFGNIEQILSLDTDVSCEASGLSETFTEGDVDTLTLAFFGDVDNGQSGDRRFQCIIPPGDDMGNSTMIYGLTSDNIFSFAIMSDETNENTESVEDRGDSQRLAQVTWVTYSQVDDSDITTGYLDIQYAQASLYNGPDGEFQIDNSESDDDIIFKSRSRITGTFTLDEQGEPSQATGEFFVTKYDLNYTPELVPYTTVTKTHGRGGYGAEDYSVFDIHTTADQVTDANASFCLQMPTSGTIPQNVESSNCSSLETDYAWTSATFPFDLTPSIEPIFADGQFFEGEDEESSDLILNDLSNFVLPDYATIANLP